MDAPTPTPPEVLRLIDEFRTYTARLNGPLAEGGLHEYMFNLEKIAAIRARLAELGVVRYVD